MTSELLDAKKQRDLIRDQLVTALRSYELPAELVALLNADSEATETLKTVYMQHQIHKAVMEASHA